MGAIIQRGDITEIRNFEDESQNVKSIIRRESRKGINFSGALLFRSFSTTFITLIVTRCFVIKEE